MTALATRVTKLEGMLKPECLPDVTVVCCVAADALPEAEGPAIAIISTIEPCCGLASCRWAVHGSPRNRAGERR